MIIGIVPPTPLLVPPSPPIKAAGFRVMNCVPILGATPMMVLGASTGILAAAVLVVGMYVMGRNVVGQDWFPGAVATSWMLAICWGWSVFMMVVLASGKEVVVMVACDGC